MKLKDRSDLRYKIVKITGIGGKDEYVFVQSAQEIDGFISIKGKHLSKNLFPHGASKRQFFGGYPEDIEVLTTKNAEIVAEELKQEMWGMFNGNGGMKK